MRLVTIGELVERVDQCDPNRLNRSEFVYIDISAVDRETKRIIAARRIAVAEAPSRARQLVRANDVLVSTVRPNLNNVARVPTIYQGEIASTGFCILRSDTARLNPAYLFYFSQSDPFVKRLATLATGAGYPAVTDSDVFDMQIPLPPLPKQQAIAAILEKADRLRRLRRHAQQVSETFLQAVFVRMFGDPAKNPKQWHVIRLGDDISFLTTGSRGWAQYYADKGDIFLRIQNVGRSTLLVDDLAFVNAPNSAEKHRIKVESGDLLVSMTADLGRSAVIPPRFPPAYINQHLGIVRLKTFNPNFISAYMSTAAGQRQFAMLDRGGVKSGLNFDDVESYRVFKPPLASQNNYSMIAGSFEHLSAQRREAERQAEHLFQTMLKRAFAGEL